MKKKGLKENKVGKIMRNLHRDIGYLVVGMTLIYCISGVILLFRDKGVFVYNVRMERPLAKVESGLNATGLGAVLLQNGMSRKFVLESENDSLVVFNKNELTYNIKTGVVTNLYFAKIQDSVKMELKPDLSEEQMVQTLSNARAIQGYFPTLRTADAITFNADSVVYKKASGEIVRPYLQPKLPWFVQKITFLHQLASKEAMHWVALIYAILLSFLALSSFWMYRFGTSYFKRGLVLAAIGVVLTFVFIYIV